MEQAWRVAAEDIVAAHNARADVRSEQQRAQAARVMLAPAALPAYPRSISSIR